MNKKYKLLLMMVMLLLALTMLAACGGEQPPAGGDQPAGQGDAAGEDGERTLKVAMLHSGTVGDFGWDYGHEQGRLKAEEELPWLDSIMMEGVTPGATAERVMTDLASQGYDVVIAPSGDYESDVRKVAPNYKDTTFLICCANYADTNVESFYPKSVQIWWILGKLAGSLTKSNMIGTVGAVSAAMDLQIQNAFLLGAQSVNPECKETVIFINSYYDPAAERDAALSLIDAGVDVINQATNTPAHVQAAVEKNIYAMSQFEDMSSYGPDNYISGEQFIWANYYIPTFQAIYDGTFVPNPGVNEPDYWSGVLEKVAYGPMVTDEMKAMVEAAEAEMEENPMIMWKGPIYDNQGNLRVAEGEYITDEELVAMDWFVQGVTSTGGN